MHFLNLNPCHLTLNAFPPTFDQRPTPPDQRIPMAKTAIYGFFGDQQWPPSVTKARQDGVTKTADRQKNEGL